jgi:hypothetical protein
MLGNRDFFSIKNAFKSFLEKNLIFNLLRNPVLSFFGAKKSQFFFFFFLNKNKIGTDFIHNMKQLEQENALHNQSQ